MTKINFLVLCDKGEDPDPKPDVKLKILDLDPGDQIISDPGRSGSGTLLSSHKLLRLKIYPSTILVKSLRGGKHLFAYFFNFWGIFFKMNPLLNWFIL